MSKDIKPKFYGLVAEFDDDQQLVKAGRAAREFGYSKLETYTPFPVHGIDEAIGVPRSKLGWVIAIGGTLGLCTAVALIYYTGVISYPLVIGGKPLFAVEFAVPPMFELTILFSAFAAVFGMLAFNKLPQYYHPIFNYSNYEKMTDDAFLLAIEANDPLFDPDESAALMVKMGARKTELVEA